jgi:hypothetical protein
VRSEASVRAIWAQRTSVAKSSRFKSARTHSLIRDFRARGRRPSTHRRPPPFFALPYYITRATEIRAGHSSLYSQWVHDRPERTETDRIDGRDASERLARSLKRHGTPTRFSTRPSPTEARLAMAMLAEGFGLDRYPPLYGTNHPRIADASQTPRS